MKNNLYIKGVYKRGSDTKQKTKRIDKSFYFSKNKHTPGKVLKRIYLTPKVQDKFFRNGLDYSVSKRGYKRRYSNCQSRKYKSRY